MIRSGIRLLVMLALFILVGCDVSGEQVAGGSTSETRTTLVDIQGKVVSNTGNPLPAIQVRARQLGLATTTDGNGKYQLRAEYAVLEGTMDTLDFFRDGRKIHSLPIPAWVVTMETVVLVQREISGEARGLRPDHRVYAVVNGLATGTVMELENESWSELRWTWTDYSDSLTRYSGFLWFRYTGALDTFHIAIIVRDSTGLISGASEVTTFTSRRGDVVIPEFEADNQVPLFALRQIRANVWGLDLTRFGDPPYRYVELDSIATSRSTWYGDPPPSDWANAEFEFRTENSGWAYYGALPNCHNLQSSSLALCRPSGYQSYPLGVGKVLATPGRPLLPEWIFVRARGLTGQITTDSVLIWGVEQLGRSRIRMDSHSSFPSIGGVQNFELELQIANFAGSRYRFLWDGEPMGSGSYAPLPTSNTWIKLDTLVMGRCPEKGSFFTLSLEVCDAELQSCGISDTMKVVGYNMCPFVPETLP
jgi:hypothetical protein